MAITLSTGLGSPFLIEGPRESFSKESGMTASVWLCACDFAGRATAAGDWTVRAVWENFGHDLGRFLQPYLESLAPERLLVLGDISPAWSHFAPVLQSTVTPFLPTPGLLGPAASLGGLRVVLSDSKAISSHEK